MKQMVVTQPYRNSGIGRELGEYCLANYTEVKTVIINPNNK